MKDLSNEIFSVVAEPSGNLHVSVFGIRFPVPNPEAGQQILDAARRSYHQGARDARSNVRTALGLRDWGGDVKCTDR